MKVHTLPAVGDMGTLERPEMDDLELGLKCLGYKHAPVPLLGDNLDGVYAELYRSKKPDRYGVVILSMADEYDVLEIEDFPAFARFLRELMPEYRQIAETFKRSLDF